MSSGPPVRKLKQSLLSFATHGRPGSFWPKAELSSKQSKAMQNRAQTKAEAGVPTWRRRWGRTISYIMHEIWPIGSLENHKIVATRCQIL